MSFSFFMLWQFAIIASNYIKLCWYLIIEPFTEFSEVGIFKEKQFRAIAMKFIDFISSLSSVKLQNGVKLPTKQKRIISTKESLNLVQ